MGNEDVIFDFSDKNFLVVGASSGIGRQIAIELADAGGHVLAIARNEKRLNELQEYSSNITSKQLDVTTAEVCDWSSVLTDYVAEKGKLHGVVYTAGITGATVLRCFDEELAQRIMDTSYWGAIRCLQITSKKKIVQKSASFVLFASVAGMTGEKGLGAYSAAKSAVITVVKSFAHDLSKDLHRINSISPGFIGTEMSDRAEADVGEAVRAKERHLLGLGSTRDVSGMVLFLLSNRAKWVTGQNFIIDGGYMSGAWN